MPWHKLASDRDCEHLLDVFGGFHDSCLREMHLWSDHYVNNELSMSAPPGLDIKARLLFQRQYKNPSAIELLFEEVIDVIVNPTEENYDSIILDAELKRENAAYHFDAEEMIRVVARNLSWRDASNWMGSELRYRSTEDV